MDFKTLLNDLKDTTSEYDKNEIESGKLMSLLAYLGILCLIPYFVENNNKFVRYHAIQGLNLFLYFVIYTMIAGALAIVLIFIPIIGWLAIAVIGLVEYAFFALSIWGIVNVFQEKAKELPIINKYKLIQK